MSQSQNEYAALSERAKVGYELPSGGGEAFWLLGMLQMIKISGHDTRGQFGMIEIVVPEGLGSPWHVHPDENEWFYVLDGAVTFYVGDARLDLTAGGFAFGPMRVPHTFIGASAEPARALVGLQPVMFEGFLREVGQPAPERVLPPPFGRQTDAKGRTVLDGRQIPREQLAAIGAKHGLVILGPPGPPPGR
jgi:quercetin dioxygenase-like cupin family protein